MAFATGLITRKSRALPKPTWFSSCLKATTRTYVNAVEFPSNRYEDYIVQDLLSDVEAKLPIAKGRANHAIVGVSMGGFGAIKPALSNPDLFVFAGALSPAIDVPRRRFSFRRVQQSWAVRSILGHGAATRAAATIRLIARSVAAAKAPYLFVSCDADESLLPANREFCSSAREATFVVRVSCCPGRSRLDAVE